MKPGIYPADTDYQSIDAVNISRLLLLQISALHYRRNPKKDTKPMSLGTAAHCATLEPARFRRDFAIWETTYQGGEKVGKQIKGEGDRRPRSGKAWEAFSEEARMRGCSIVTDDEFQKATAIAEAIRTDPIAGRILSRGKAEHILVWEFDGVLCKGRLDWMEEPVIQAAIDDLKTSADITPRRFDAICARYKYHVRMAWYARGYQILTGTYPAVSLIAVESGEPHDVVVKDYPDDILAIGEDECHRLVSLLKSCQESGEWPGIGGGCRNLMTLPRYEYPDDEETDMEDTNAAA